MKNQQLGFGGLQVILVVAVIGIMSVVAVPKYKSFIGKAKITEAFNIAGESKRKLSEFYMVNGGLPTQCLRGGGHEDRHTFAARGCPRHDRGTR